MDEVFVSGSFDDLRSRHIRFLTEAARYGRLTVVLWPDALVASLTGSPPRFGLEERLYLLESLRMVEQVIVAPVDFDPERPALPQQLSGGRPAARETGGTWVLTGDIGGPDEAAVERTRLWLGRNGIGCRVLGAGELAGFPYSPPPHEPGPGTGRKRVVVTGCYDWFHSGHARFFEEAAAYGELNVVIGSDVNVRLLKGEGHPLIPETERRFVVGSMRAVTRCLVSSGSGWLDAEPEIRALGIGRYVVNEDGDKAEKRRFCEENGIEYIVLKRTPKAGLPRRASTDMRGF